MSPILPTKNADIAPKNNDFDPAKSLALQNNDVPIAAIAGNPYFKPIDTRSLLLSEVAK